MEIAEKETGCDMEMFTATGLLTVCWLSVRVAEAAAMIQHPSPVTGLSRMAFQRKRE
jgi:hypothetical protein